jgi:sugar O-acyltransferase (sialic acid O-acetyltransferase NeuD family)
MRIVLIGGGGHASDVLGLIEEIGKDEVVGIVADDEISEARFNHRGVRKIGELADLPNVDATHYIIAVGFSQGRKIVHDKIRPGSLKPATLIHPRAYIPRGVPVGAGTVLLAGVCVSPMANIGNHVYLSHGCLIGHDCRIEDFATVLPGAAVSGNTVLAEGAMIGTNAAVIEGCSIGAWATVGAGAVVLKDVPAHATAVGVPAKWQT